MNRPGYSGEVVLARPFMVGPVGLRGFLVRGGTDDVQAIYRRTDYPDFGGNRRQSDDVAFLEPLPDNDTCFGHRTEQLVCCNE